VAWEADISGLDPHLSFGMQARHVVGNLFNSLVTIDAELNFIHDLAESWEILEDSQVYVFHRYVVEHMITTSVSSYGHLQAARSYVKGYENLHGYKLRFETTWLEK
jgi:hypothetical protein